jgi:DNA-binding transcriptional MerR regulator
VSLQLPDDSLMSGSTSNESTLKTEVVLIDLQKSLKKKGYSIEESKELLEKEVLFLSANPEELSTTNKQELLTHETVNLKKILADEVKSLKIDFVLDKNKTHKYLELKAASIDVGVICFLSLTAWELCKGIISNWIYDQFLAMRKVSKNLHSNFELQIEEGETKIHLSYSGPADEVAEIIKEIRLQ